VRGPKDRRARPEGGRVLGEGQRPHQLWALGERRKLPPRGPGRAPQNFEFSAFWDFKMASRQCKMMVFAQVFFMNVTTTNSANYSLTIKSGYKRAVLSQGNRAMPQLFFSV